MLHVQLRRRNRSFTNSLMATEKLFLRGNNRDSFAYEDENQPLARPDSNIDDYIIGKQVDQGSTILVTLVSL